jgi:DNA-binding MarR family transcriptional regulator
LDFIAPVIDLLSVALLVFVIFVGYRTVRAFRQSKQAVTESASILSVIVSALTSRIEASESVVTDLRTSFDTIGQRSAELEGEQRHLRSSYLQVLGCLQEALSNDKRLISDLEQLKTRLTSTQEKRTVTQDAPTQVQRTQLLMPSADLLAALTPTERHTLEILAREGPKAAPELARRMRKSREHMARLMKKLYLEGYVDRESNHAPFRYKLNEKIGSVLQPSEKTVTAEASEKV